MLFLTTLRPVFSFSVIILWLFLTASTATGLPVLKKSPKTPYNQDQTPRVEKSTSLKPAILGRYGDISHIKKPNKTQEVARSKARVLRHVSARSAIIIDAISGKTLFSKNSNNPRQPASTIKVLTGMIALKSLKTSEQISVSKKAARQPRSKIYLDQRKKYLADDLINAVLLASANDASVALAEKIAGSEKSFARMMTLRAKLWGAKHTICKTATGLTANGQKSTARDLAIIFKHAMQDPDFARRMKKTKVRTSGGKLLRNHNKALWQVKGTEGGKTGYTNAARQTYVGKFKRGPDEIIVAIMGSETMWADLKRLVSYGFKKKQLADVETSGSFLIAERN